MYGYHDPASNVYSAPRLTNSPSQASVPAAQPPTRYYASSVESPHMTLYNVQNVPQGTLPQPTQAVMSEPQWATVPNFYGNILSPTNPSIADVSVASPPSRGQQPPQRLESRDPPCARNGGGGGSPGLYPAAPPAVSKSPSAPTMYAPATTTTTTTAYIAGDVPRLYAQRPSATAATFTPLSLAGVPDSRRTSLNVQERVAAGAGSNNPGGTLYQSLVSYALPPGSQQAGSAPPSRRTSSQQQQQQQPSYVPSSAFTSHRTSLTTHHSLQDTTASTTLDGSPAFFTTIGNAFAQSAAAAATAETGAPPLRPRAASAFSFAQSASQAASTFSSSATSGPSPGTATAVHAILIEQPLPRGTTATLIAQTREGQPTQYFLHSVDTGGNSSETGTGGSSSGHVAGAAVAQPVRVSAAPQHFDTVVNVEARQYFAGQTPVVPTSLQQHPSYQSPQQQQQQQQQQLPLSPPLPPWPANAVPQQQQQQLASPFHSPTHSSLSHFQQQHQPQSQQFYSPLQPIEHARPVIAPMEHNYVPPAVLNTAPTRPSFSSGEVILRRPTRSSFPSANSANLFNHPPSQRSSLSQAALSPPLDVAALRQPQPQPHQQSHPHLNSHPARHGAPVAPLASPQLPSASVAESARHEKATPALSATAAAAAITSAPHAVAVASPPQSPSRGIARRNRDKAVLFVGQLNYEATEADVAQIFSCYGKPLSVVVLKDKGKSSRRGGSASAAAAAAAAAQRKVGGSAFVTYATTLEADTAISALHGRYNAKNDDPENDDETKYLQVSYGQQTGLISTFGIQHAERLHASKPENPIPLIALERQRARASGDAADT